MAEVVVADSLSLGELAVEDRSECCSHQAGTDQERKEHLGAFEFGVEHPPRGKLI